MHAPSPGALVGGPLSCCWRASWLPAVVPVLRERLRCLLPLAHLLPGATRGAGASAAQRRFSYCLRPGAATASPRRSSTRGSSGPSGKRQISDFGPGTWRGGRWRYTGRLMDAEPAALESGRVQVPVGQLGALFCGTAPDVDTATRASRRDILPPTEVV